MSAPFPRGLTAIIKTVFVPASARGSDEEILERVERQLEERQQEYEAEGFICGCEPCEETPANDLVELNRSSNDAT
jgi:hypothetical protein